MTSEIQALGGISESLKPKQIQIGGSGDGIFTDALDKAKSLINATAVAEQNTTERTYDFMAGKNENIHDLMIAQEKSSILLQFTMQVRNNLLEAYREIMRMPV